MTWAIVAVAAITVVTGAAQAKQTRAAGRIAAGEAEVAAKQEELGAIQRETDRKEKLIQALASQSATAGAGGVFGFEGSPLTILKEDISREERATERDVFQAKLAAMTTRARGKIAKTQASTQANIGLLKTAGSAISAGSTGGG